jgi:hypothetical protein
MNPEYRMKLLPLQSHVEQPIAEAQPLTVEPNGDDETLLRVSKQLAELWEVLVEEERKLRACERKCGAVISERSEELIPPATS